MVEVLPTFRLRETLVTTHRVDGVLHKHLHAVALGHRLLLRLHQLDVHCETLLLEVLAGRTRAKVVADHLGGGCTVDQLPLGEVDGKVDELVLSCLWS